MKLLKTDQGVFFNVYVKPDSREFKLEVEDEDLVVYCTESPVKGRVNKELVKELSRLFKRRIAIASGFSSRQKRILIRNIEVEEVTRALEKGCVRDET